MRLAVASALLVPSAALAAPVSLDFAGGTDLFIEAEDFEPIYVEEGFEIAVDGLVFTPDDGPEAGVEPALPFFTDSPSGSFPLTTAYGLSTVDGRPFDLLSIRIPGVFFNTTVIYTTEFDDGSSFDEEVASRTSELSFAATRPDGSSVDVVLDVLDAGGIAPGDEDAESFFGLADPQIDLTGLGLVGLDMVLVKLRAGFGDVAACDPKNLGRRADPSVGVPLFCGPDATLRSDVTEITAFADNFTVSNFNVGAAVDGFTVAPIPVPAGLPLLAAGLGALAWRGRRRA